MKLVKLGPFKGGMNNVAPDHRLPDDPTHGKYYLRDAVNVDITNTGTLKRRAGYSKTYAGTALTSAWSDGTTGYIVDDGQLLKVVPDVAGALTSAAVSNDTACELTKGCAFTGTPIGPVLSDGFALYRISGQTLEVFTADPPPYSAQGSGVTGVVHVTLTSVRGDVESAPGRQTMVTGGYPITITIPQGEVGYAVAYLSDVNGTELYRYGLLQDAVTVVTGPDTLSDAVLTRSLRALPAGSKLSYEFGRLWSVVGNTVFYSEPYRLNMMSPTNFVSMPDPVLVFAKTNHGFVVGTKDAVGFIKGTRPSDSDFRVILPYGVVEGTEVVDVDNNVFVMTVRGLVKVDQDGTPTNIHEGTLSVNIAQSGASCIIESDGIVRVATALFDAQAPRAAAHSFMDAEIIRKEVSA